MEEAKGKNGMLLSLSNNWKFTYCIHSFHKINQQLPFLQTTPLSMSLFFYNAGFPTLYARIIPTGQEEKTNQKRKLCKIPMWPQYDSTVSNLQPLGANYGPTPIELLIRTQFFPTLLPFI